MQDMTDSHFHALAMKQKGIDPVESMRRCRERGFSFAMDIGLRPEDLIERERLFMGVQGILLSSGLAPAEADSKDWPDRLPKLEAQAATGRLAAIGEIGLDWHWNYGTRDSQMQLMESQLRIAREHQLPVVIHNRNADAEVLSLLQKGDLTAAGVMHCFSSDYGYASKCLDLGFYISFAGNVTYKNALDIQESARRIPDDRILLETDAPYLSPQPARGKTNTPEHIGFTYQFVAELRGTESEALSQTVHGNFLKLFSTSI